MDDNDLFRSGSSGPEHSEERERARKVLRAVAQLADLAVVLKGDGPAAVAAAGLAWLLRWLADAL